VDDSRRFGDEGGIFHPTAKLRTGTRKSLSIPSNFDQNQSNSSLTGAAGAAGAVKQEPMRSKQTKNK